MKTKVLLSIAVLFFSFSFLSCENKGQSRKVAVLTIDKTSDVPDDIASLARKIAIDRIGKMKNIDTISIQQIDDKISEFGATTADDLTEAGKSLGADRIVTGNIELTSKDGIFDRFIDNIKGNTAWYKVEINYIDVMENSVITSFTKIYDAKLNRMFQGVKKVKPSGK
jgi:hypothetical protein